VPVPPAVTRTRKVLERLATGPVPEQGPDTARKRTQPAARDTEDNGDGSIRVRPPGAAALIPGPFFRHRSWRSASCGWRPRSPVIGSCGCTSSVTTTRWAKAHRDWGQPLTRRLVAQCGRPRLSSPSTAGPSTGSPERAPRMARGLADNPGKHETLASVRWPLDVGAVLLEGRIVLAQRRLIARRAVTDLYQAVDSSSTCVSGPS